MIFDPVKSKRKQFYELIVSKNAKVSRGFTKLKVDFDLDKVILQRPLSI